MPSWSNWSGRIRCSPAEHPVPRTDDEVATIVRDAADAGRIVRMRGTGHSNTALCATDGVLVAPEGLAGIETIAPDRSTATVGSGTVLADLAAALQAEGLALHNLGDIDVQTIGGATGTGTHGTGPALGNVATAIVGARIVTADGAITTCSPEERPELFAAARVSLGGVGIVTALTLAVVPTYRLHERIWHGPGGEVLGTLADHIAATRHYEFFWFPHRDLVEHKALAFTEADPDPLADRKRERIDHWNAILPSRRELRFNEMEYSVPAVAGPACFAALRTWMLAERPDVQWPVEYRTVAGDDIWLSPHTGRPSVTISVHLGADDDCEALFRAAEPILLAHDGRPHWGKVHFRTGADLAPRYPHWDDWWRVRDTHDPDDRFLNDHLASLRGR